MDLFLLQKKLLPKTVNVFGEEYPISYIKSEKTCIMFCNDEFLVYAPKINKDIFRALMEEWYKKKAREIFTKRVEYYLPQIGKTVNRISIRGQRTRWGSCSSKGNLANVSQVLFKRFSKRFVFKKRVTLINLPIVDF